MQAELLAALKECAGILTSRTDAPSVLAADVAPTGDGENETCGCHQPLRYCLFPHCGGRQQ